jgi:hypothetical protein
MVIEAGPEAEKAFYIIKLVANYLCMWPFLVLAKLLFSLLICSLLRNKKQAPNNLR